MFSGSWMVLSSSKCGNKGDTQSVKNQVGQDEEPAEGNFIMNCHTYVQGCSSHYGQYGHGRIGFCRHCAPLLTKASLVKLDSHMHACAGAWTIKVLSSNSEHVLAVRGESREWLRSTASLVIFWRLVKYPTNLSIISFQDTSLASLKLSVVFFNDHCMFGTIWVIFSCMFQCLTCISLKWNCRLRSHQKQS